MRPTKRGLIAAGLLASVAPTRLALAATVPAAATGAAARDLAAYVGFGVKASGGPGDNACGAWIETELSKAGYGVERHAFDVPYFDAASARVTVGEHTAPILPLLPVTTADAVEGPLFAHAATALEDAEITRGSIIAVVLPYRRWSGAAHPLIQGALATCLARGAAAVLLVTTGPSGEAIALNVPAEANSFPAPVAVIGPIAAAPLLKKRGAVARLALTGKGGTRSAFNIIASKAGKGARRIMLSTPRSGWGICAGERGPGVAVFLDLARWLAKRAGAATLLCTSGHEFENLGGHRFLSERAPKPDEVSMWVHIGANVAARDWHETGRALLPLPSADPQRFLMVSEGDLPVAKAAFAGLAGLETPYPLSAEAQGELKEIRAAGFARALGIFGAHRYHHTALDDARTIDAALIPPVSAALRKFIAGAV